MNHPLTTDVVLTCSKKEKAAENFAMRCTQCDGQNETFCDARICILSLNDLNKRVNSITHCCVVFLNIFFMFTQEILLYAMSQLTQVNRYIVNNWINTSRKACSRNYKEPQLLRTDSHCSNTDRGAQKIQQRINATR